MITDVAYYTSRGNRENNEDYIAITDNEETLLAIVADGLGGCSFGELASKQAVEIIKSEIRYMKTSSSALLNAIEKANQELFINHSYDSMNTTIAVAWLNDNEALFGNAGDTRIYLFRNNQVYFQTVDHSVSQMAVLAGEISSEQIRGHEDRNKLVRVLGNKSEVKPDISKIFLEDRDAILICSDGFWENVLERDMIYALSRSNNSYEWIENMRHNDSFISATDKDNNTAIAIIINK